ncbi:hypothetical protein I302_107644 [Kwoniella bestiolae CBS 10118]|uniref:Uncharacterized protein n=1 Tax=Kwoniella bestiolae CBS 10118 TaxID=1296100 RepID=A0A1B9FXY6_9TREE|nr:hypothetical protein I302_06617 [Kwoniella bestiolae CBS 10118]OCF23634.1 hypothetical protein I302_06617 [Kwoniella bestiolae CBS 10118]
MSNAAQPSAILTTQRSATKYTSPTVIACIRKGEDKKIYTGSMYWLGPSITDDQKDSFLKYHQECRKTLASLTDNKEKLATLRTMSEDQLIETVQSELDQVPSDATADFRAIALNEKGIPESWRKVAKATKLSGRGIRGFLALSVKDPNSISEDATTGWLNFWKKKDTVITGCKMLNRVEDGPLRVEADRQLHSLGSRYLDMKRTQEWPSASDATKLLQSKAYKGCKVITVSEALLSLPMFEDVRYTRSSEELSRYSDRTPEDCLSAHKEAPANLTETSMRLHTADGRNEPLIDVEEMPTRSHLH